MTLNMECAKVSARPACNASREPMALKQRDLKLILAYGTVSQLGFITAIVAIVLLWLPSNNQ